jgi:NAD(P)-dependent dehydrogenase (short-subunit alcohol dehydrogenase family)
MHPSIDYQHLPDPTAAHYSKWPWYGQSKYANILFANELNRRYAEQGVTAYSVHPGIVHTDIYRTAGFQGAAFRLVTWPYSKTLLQGASTSLYVATSPDVRGEGEGQYFADNSLVPSVMKRVKPGEAEKLWQWTDELIKSKTSCE